MGAPSQSSLTRCCLPDVKGPGFNLQGGHTKILAMKPGEAIPVLSIDNTVYNTVYCILYKTQYRQYRVRGTNTFHDQPKFLILISLQNLLPDLFPLID